MTRESVLSRVRRIRGVSYAWKAGEEPRGRGTGERELGVIAQEVEGVFPEAVSTDAEGLKRVDYLGLVAVLIEAVKELDARLTALEERPAPPDDARRRGSPPARRSTRS